MNKFEDLEVSKRTIRSHGLDMDALMGRAPRPEQLVAVVKEYANSQVKVYGVLGEERPRSLRFEVELKGGKVILPKYSQSTGLVTLPPQLEAVQVQKGLNKEVLVALPTRDSNPFEPSYKFEDRDRRSFGFAWGKNVELALAKELGIEDDEITAAAAGNVITPDLTRWINLRLGLWS